jgi:Zn-dependent metalloprotease
MAEQMARAADPRIRAQALVSLAHATAVRAARGVAGEVGRQAVAAPAPAGRQRLVYTANNKDMLPGRLVRSEGEPPTADPCVNEAYDFSGDTYDFYLERFGRNSLDNAFWDGGQMAYGDGDGVVFQCFTRSLEVVAHELTHGVQAFTSDLVYRGQSGAINEHFADVFGVLVRQWRRQETGQRANWLVGADILVPAPTRRAIRDMERPGTAYVADPVLGTDPQSDHMARIYAGSADAGGVHINSGIPNRAFVLFAQAVGGPAWDTPGGVWYEALLRLPRTATFATLAKTTARIATERVSAAAGKACRAAWKQVGL